MERIFTGRPSHGRQTYSYHGTILNFRFKIVDIALQQENWSTAISLMKRTTEIFRTSVIQFERTEKSLRSDLHVVLSVCVRALLTTSSRCWFSSDSFFSSVVLSRLTTKLR